MSEIINSFFVHDYRESASGQAIMISTEIYIIHKDWKGVLTIYPGHEKLRDQIREYFQIRNEDSIDND